MESKQAKVGICLQAYIPLRKEPAEQAEMTSQVIFGEFVEIIEITEMWLYVKILFDNYEGWIDKNSITLTDSFTRDNKAITIRNTTLINTKSNKKVHIPIGSVFPNSVKNQTEIISTTFKATDPSAIINKKTMQLKKVIEQLEGIPFIWGGRTGYGFDCSGLTQYLLRTQGKKIPRDSSEQARLGITLNFLNETKTGDLAFFDNSEGIITHVGAIIDSNTILHASGRVRFDKLDQQGIYNEALGKYTHRLRIIKRV